MGQINEDRVRKRLENMGYFLVGEYVDKETTIRVLCAACDTLLMTTYNEVTGHNYQCPGCTELRDNAPTTRIARARHGLGECLSFNTKQSNVISALVDEIEILAVKVETLERQRRAQMTQK